MMMMMMTTRAKRISPSTSSSSSSEVHKHNRQQQQQQSLSSLIKANLQIHRSEDNVNVNLEAYFKWRKQHEKEQQQQQQQQQRRAQGVVQNAERFLENRQRTWRNRNALRPHLEEKNRQQQKSQQQQQSKRRFSNNNNDNDNNDYDDDDDDDDDTASVTTYATVAGSCASSSQWENDCNLNSNSTKMTTTTATTMNAVQVFARPPPSAAAASVVVAASQPDNSNKSNGSSSSSSSSASHVKEHNNDGGAMDFLTAVMSARDEASRQAGLAEYQTCWNVQQQQQQHGTRPKRRRQRRQPPLRNNEASSASASLLPGLGEDYTTTVLATSASTTSSTSFMAFLTAAMSASDDETARQETIANFGEWINCPQQQHQEQQQEQQESSLFWDEETGKQQQQPLQQQHQQQQEQQQQQDGMLWSAAKAIAGYVVTTLGNKNDYKSDTNTTETDSSSSSSSSSSQDMEPSVLEQMEDQSLEENDCMTLPLQQQQPQQEQQTRLPDMNDENTTAMDYLSAAVATTDEEERKRIITAYHVWKDKQEELLLSCPSNNNNDNSCPVASTNNSSNNNVKSMVTVKRKRSPNTPLASQKLNDESNTAILDDKKPQQQQQLQLDRLDNPMDFLTAAMAAPDDDARQEILDSYANKMQTSTAGHGLDDDDTTDRMDAYDRAQVLAEEGNLTVAAEAADQQQQARELVSLVPTDKTTNPMTFFNAIVAASDDDTKERVLSEYQAQVEQEQDAEDDEDYDDDDDDDELPPSCENNTAMAFLTSAMAAPDDQAKEQVLADYQAWSQTQAVSSLTKKNDNSTTAMAFLAAAMAVPDANAKEAVLVDYQEWARHQETTLDSDDDDSEDYGLGEVLADYEAWKISRVEKYLLEHLQNKKMQDQAAAASESSSSSSDDDCCPQESSGSSWGKEEAPVDDFSWRRESSSSSSSSSSRHSTNTYDLMTDSDNELDDTELGLGGEEDIIIMQQEKKKRPFDYSDDDTKSSRLQYKFNARLQQKYDLAAASRNKSLLFQQEQQFRLDELQKRGKPVMADYFTCKKQLYDEPALVAIVVDNPDDNDERCKKASSHATDTFSYADDKNAKSSDATSMIGCRSRRGLKIGALLLVILGLIAFIIVRQVRGMHRVIGYHETNQHDVVPIVDAAVNGNSASGDDASFGSSSASDTLSEKKDAGNSLGAGNIGTVESSVGSLSGGKKFFLLDIPELTSELLLNYTHANANRFYANGDPLHRAEMWLHRGFEQMTVEQGRTMDPREADVFLVPAYLHWRSSLPVELDRQVAPMIEARLIDKSKPHVLLVPTTSPIRSSAIHLRPLPTLLRKAGVDVYSVGFERNTFWQGLDSDRIIPIPHLVETPRYIPSEVSSSAAALDGNRTENFVFYAEDALADSVVKSGCDRSMVAPLLNRADMDVRLLPEDDEPLSMIDRHRHMSESEFCLVTCGMTPTTDTLAASVIAGCIPIRVGSRWQGECEKPCHPGWGWNLSPQGNQTTHLPFSDQIDWDAFPQVNEAAFAHDPLATLQEVFRTTSSEDKLKLQAEMKRVQLSLIYGWGSPVVSNHFGEVYQHIFETIVYNIGLAEEEGW